MDIKISDMVMRELLPNDIVNEECGITIKWN